MPHSPNAVTESLCEEHHAAWDSALGRAPARSPGGGPAGAGARDDRLHPAARPGRVPVEVRQGARCPDRSATRLLDVVAGWFVEDDCDFDEIFAEDDEFALWTGRHLADVAAQLGAEAAAETADTIRRLRPKRCWAVDVDLASVLEREGRTGEAMQLADHLASHGWETPSAYYAAGELYEMVGRYPAAESMFRRAVARGVALDEPEVADLAFVGFRRLFGRRDDRAGDVTEADRLRETLRSRGTSALRPGRNDPCLCAGGRKWKHCCA